MSEQTIDVCIHGSLLLPCTECIKLAESEPVTIGPWERRGCFECGVDFLAARSEPRMVPLNEVLCSDCRERRCAERDVADRIAHLERQVTELQEANNREVERRRAAEAESERRLMERNGHALLDELEQLRAVVAAVEKVEAELRVLFASPVQISDLYARLVMLEKTVFTNPSLAARVEALEVKIAPMQKGFADRPDKLSERLEEIEDHQVHIEKHLIGHAKRLRALEEQIRGLASQAGQGAIGNGGSTPPAAYGAAPMAQTDSAGGTEPDDGREPAPTPIEVGQVWRWIDGDTFTVESKGEGERWDGIMIGESGREITGSVTETALRQATLVSSPAAPAATEQHPSPAPLLVLDELVGVMRRGVAGLTQGACMTCGAEPGCNIDCPGCLWVGDAEAALAKAEKLVLKVDDPFSVDSLEKTWEGAKEFLRSQGDDPDEVLSAAAKVVDHYSKHPYQLPPPPSKEALLDAARHLESRTPVVHTNQQVGEFRAVAAWLRAVAAGVGGRGDG